VKLQAKRIDSEGGLGKGDLYEKKSKVCHRQRLETSIRGKGGKGNYRRGYVFERGEIKIGTLNVYGDREGETAI